MQNILDQTANLNQDKLELSLCNAKVLVIGSGHDIDGRCMGDMIDNSNTWDYILRINKTYGDPVDSGRRTDILVTRWSQWCNCGNTFIEDEVLNNCKKVIILNQNVNYSKTERDMITKELNLEHVSAGVQALHWLLNRGCNHIDIMGFGDDTCKKVYCRNSKNYEAGMKDDNPLYNWKKEREWILNQPQIHLI